MRTGTCVLDKLNELETYVCGTFLLKYIPTPERSLDIEKVQAPIFDSIVPGILPFSLWTTQTLQFRRGRDQAKFPLSHQPQEH